MRLIIILLFISSFSYSQELTADYLTTELNSRIEVNEPYPDSIGYVYLPFEPYVITETIIEPYNNHRAFKKEGKWYIPVATYVNGCRESYTLFDECKLWYNTYGNIQVDIINTLYETE